MLLLIQHPELPSCADCRRWMYSPELGWQRSTRSGRKRDGQIAINEPVPRDPRTPTPCHRCPKSHDGLPHPEKELSLQNRLAYHYYRQCLVDDTGQLSRDGIVLRNNALCKIAEDQATRAEQRALRQTLAMVLGLAAGGASPGKKK